MEVPDASSGIVIEMLGQRKGQLTNMRQDGNGTVYYTYLVPTRGMLGFRQAFLTATRGTGIVHSLFYGYEPYAGAIRRRGQTARWSPGSRALPPPTPCSTRRSAASSSSTPASKSTRG